MAEPTIALQLNEGSQATPTWAAIDVAARWVGPDSADGALTDPFPAGVIDSDNAFFDNAAAPNNGELWNEKTGATVDTQCTVAGRNTNTNVLRALETGGTDGTADPPELSAYDDATDAANRTAPTVAILAGTAGSSNISFIRAIETTGGAPGAGWTGQVHDAAPSAGAELAGNGTGQKVVCASVLAASGNKIFNLAACAPHDSPTGVTSFVYCFQYTWV